MAYRAGSGESDSEGYDGRRQRSRSPRGQSRRQYGDEAPAARYFASKPVRSSAPNPFKYVDDEKDELNARIARLRPSVERREAYNEYTAGNDRRRRSRPGFLEPAPEYDEDLVEFASRVAAFKLPGLSLNLQVQPASDIAGQADEERDALSKPSKAINVFQSQYTGDGLMEGSHSASLTVRHDSQGKSPCLFRWLHVQQDVMNLDSLSDQTLQLPGLSKTEQAAVLKLVYEVKKNYSKPVWTSKQTTVRHMAPAFRQVPLRTTRRYTAIQNQSQDAQNHATWICIPYLSLAKYSGLEASADPASYPTETLLQSSYARIARKRDMAQVVRQVGIGDDASCFHIPQLWCIIVGDDLLVTCGVMSQAELRGDVAEPAKGVPNHKSVTIVSEPPKESNDGARIMIRYEGSVTWAIPVKECPTYFSFISRFREFWPRLVRFHYSDHRLVDGRLWEKIQQDIRNSKKDVVLSMQVSPPAKLPSLTRLKEGFPSVRHVPPRSPRPESPHAKAASDSAPGSTRKAPDTSTEQPKRQEFPFRPRQDKDFHIFSWIRGEGQTRRLSHEDIGQYMDGINEFLTSSSNAPWDLLYAKASSSLHSAVYSYLTHKQQDLDRETEDREAKEEIHAQRVRLYNAAEILYGFFLPLQFEGAVSSKYWGAIMKLVSNYDAEEYPRGGPRRERGDRPRGDRPHPAVLSVLWTFKQYIPVIMALNELLSSSTDRDKAGLQIPDDLVQTWILIVISLLRAASSHGGDWSTQLEDAMDKLRAGIGRLVASLPTPSLNESAIVLPLDLAVLMLPRLLSDSNGQYPGYSQIYSSYLQELEAEIMGMKSDISYQNRINLAQQEIAVVQKTVEAQKAVIRWVISAQDSKPRTPGLGRTKLGAPVEYYGRPADAGMRWERRLVDDDILENDPLTSYEEVSRLSPTDPHGLRSLLLRECANILRGNAQDFLEYQNQAGSLEQMNANKVSITKDRQEQLIYAFTVVTIIFLPLGTVSSIFGMNTADIRDMELGQWAFWAAAVPVSAVVIFAGLYMVGAFEQMAAWAGKMLRGGDEDLFNDRPPPYKRYAEDETVEIRRTSGPPVTVIRNRVTRGPYNERTAW